MVNTKSIIEMANGLIKERIDASMTKVIENIMDVQTSQIAKRTIVVTIDFSPRENRRAILVGATVKEKLCPPEGVCTALCMQANPLTGEARFVEMVPEVPGQMDMDGMEAEEAAVLKLVKEA